MFTVKIKAGLLLSLIMAVACSSAPNIAELPMTADPSQEIARVGEGIKQAQVNQVNLLSPKNFESASDSLDKAKEARSKNKDQKQILHLIAVAQAYLDKANGVANVANQLIPGVVKERQNAITAGAPKYFPKEFDKVEKDLSTVTANIEANDTSGAESARGSLEKTL